MVASIPPLPRTCGSTSRAYPGQSDRALLAHIQEQIPGFDGVLPEDLAE